MLTELIYGRDRPVGGGGVGWGGMECWSPSCREARDWADKVSGVSQSLRLSWLALHLICIALPGGKPGRWGIPRVGATG